MTINVEVLSFGDAYVHYESAWNGLCDTISANPSIYPSWQRLALTSHSRIDDALVLVFTERSRLIAVMPVFNYKRRLRGVSTEILELTSNLVSYHPELIAEPGRLQDVLEALRRPKVGLSWDVIWLSSFDKRSTAAKTLIEIASRNGCPLLCRNGEQSPYIEIDCSWKEFLARRTKKFRANITRYSKRLAVAGETAMQWFGPGDPLDALLSSMLEIEDASWKKDKGVAITDRSEEVLYHGMLLDYLSRSGMLFANVLKLEGKAVSYVLCANHKGWVGQLKTSCRLDVADAGSIAVSESVRRAFELGYRVYDFLGDADPHKLVWTDKVRQHATYLLCNRTVRGRWLALSEKLAAVGVRNNGTKDSAIS